MNHIKSAIERVVIILSASFCMFSTVVPVSANTTSYGLTGHLGNVRAVVSEDGADAGAGIDILSATDYYPGGMRLPNRWYISENYRFGYQGQFAEKDPETGYNQFEARLYDARLGRWMAPDPAGQYWSPYMAMGNNWPGIIDPDGRYGRWSFIRDGVNNGTYANRADARAAWNSNYRGSFNYDSPGTSDLFGLSLKEGAMCKSWNPYYSSSQNSVGNFLARLDRSVDKGYANNIQEYENWEEKKGLIEKGIPTMSIAATIAVTGGLGAGGAISHTYELIIPTISLANSIHSVSGSPLNNSFEGMPIVSTSIDLISGSVDLFTQPQLLILKIPTITTSFISAGTSIINPQNMEINE